MNDIIYFDNAATTKVCAEAEEAMLSAEREWFFNPSALYAPSAKITADIREKRNAIKAALGATSGELYFTSGGTESNNTALFGAKKRKGERIIISEGEHDSIIAAANELKAQGYDVCFAPINSDGSVNVEAYKELLNDRVALASVMLASNETGAINDVKSLCKATKKVSPNAIFHTDAVQAFLKTSFGISALGVDSCSISAHKINGPKGIGGLYVAQNAAIKPLLYGGGQEKGFRSGTQSYPLICGFAAAVQKNISSYDEKYSKLSQYREYFAKNLQTVLDDVAVITPLQNSVPNILTVAFCNVRGEVLLHTLEKDNIFVGIGSACSSHRESRFKKLLGLDDEHRDGIVRFSFCEDNTYEQADFALEKIVSAVKLLSKTGRI